MSHHHPELGLVNVLLEHVDAVAERLSEREGKDSRVTIQACCVRSNLLMLRVLLSMSVVQGGQAQ